MTYDQEQIEYFINGFVQAMLFATTDDEGEALDANYSGSDIEAKSFERIKKNCLEFLEKAGDKLDPLDLEQSGMDFFYVRNGHGVGFFDRELPKDEALILTNIAMEFSPMHVFTLDKEVFCE